MWAEGGAAFEPTRSLCDLLWDFGILGAGFWWPFSWGVAAPRYQSVGDVGSSTAILEVLRRCCRVASSDVDSDGLLGRTPFIPCPAVTLSSSSGSISPKSKEPVRVAGEGDVWGFGGGLGVGCVTDLEVFGGNGGRGLLIRLAKDCELLES